MEFFDFHHHKKYIRNGIYNLAKEIPPDFPYSVGIHPNDIDVNNLKEQLSWMRSMISQNCFAIGECGLDSLVSADENLQNEAFLQQIMIANEVKKPIIIHCVRKFYEVISFRKKAEQPMIIHGFNKKKQIAEDLLAHNFYLSFGKAVLYNLSLQEILKNIPPDKFFLETDNEDFNIEELYFKVSEIRGISPEDLNEQILHNLYSIRNG
ncbi:TatD family hydrolase [Chryseobacterium culicis]|uniref:TatD DNase family protein n=1 Tax=Chryseobacterium culicis TaxID=680127 RepID=A0A1H6I632_CHRCI|nr:TatD family hydrolase [Chryseobacterium culicis]SEH42270.1 TatD DNase family protein [Chryseobacterium culicis]